MIRFDRSHRTLAVGISLLAGFVDAIGFLESGAFFVSFMTGNSTRLAVGAAEWQSAAPIAAGIIALFVGGVVAGSLLAARNPRARSQRVLASVTLLLALAAALRLMEFNWPAIGCLALAMGAVNAALEGQNGVVVGVTYMTGTLVQIGQKIANSLRGEENRHWLPHLGLWMGLIGGAVAGARVVLWWPLAGYALAVLLAAALTCRAAVLARRAAT